MSLNILMDIQNKNAKTACHMYLAQDSLSISRTTRTKEEKHGRSWKNEPQNKGMDNKGLYPEFAIEHSGQWQIYGYTVFNIK